jgi:hypothetical protein
MSRREEIVSCIDVEFMDHSANIAGVNHAGTLPFERALRLAETEAVPQRPPASSSDRWSAGHPYSQSGDHAQKRWKIPRIEGREELQ